MSCLYHEVRGFRSLVERVVNDVRAHCNFQAARSAFKKQLCTCPGSKKLTTEPAQEANNISLKAEAEEDSTTTAATTAATTDATIDAQNSPFGRVVAYLQQAGEHETIPERKQALLSLIRIVQDMSVAPKPAPVVSKKQGKQGNQGRRISKYMFHSRPCFQPRIYFRPFQQPDPAYKIVCEAIEDPVQLDRDAFDRSCIAKNKDRIKLHRVIRKKALLSICSQKKLHKLSKKLVKSLERLMNKQATHRISGRKEQTRTKHADRQQKRLLCQLVD